MNSLFKTRPRADTLEKMLDPVREMVAACMQCGTCSASCPNIRAMDWPPRKMWRALLMHLDRELLKTRTFWLCSSCYTCTLRCPRGLPLTEAVAALKRAAVAHGDAGGDFYRIFTENAVRFGRVQEGELMRDYMLAKKSPLMALGFAPLGYKLWKKGKIHPVSKAMAGVLDPLFKTGEGRAEP